MASLKRHRADVQVQRFADIINDFFDSNVVLYHVNYNALSDFWLQFVRQNPKFAVKFSALARFKFTRSELLTDDAQASDWGMKSHRRPSVHSQKLFIRDLVLHMEQSGAMRRFATVTAQSRALVDEIRQHYNVARNLILDLNALTNHELEIEDFCDASFVNGVMGIDDVAKAAV